MGDWMQVKDMAGLAVGVTEILATDLAIPLARDVAMPILNYTFNSLNKEGSKVGMVAQGRAIHYYQLCTMDHLDRSSPLAFCLQIF